MARRRLVRRAWALALTRDSAGYSNTNASPSANSALTMITLTKPIERKGAHPLAASPSAACKAA